MAAIVSCRKTETPVKPETEPEQKEEKEEKEETKTVLYGSLGETTKTYLSPNSGETQFDVYWEYQDCITIKNNTKDGACATFWTEEATGSKPTVPFKQKSEETFELETDDIIEAFYPAEIYGESLIWPSEQRYVVYSDTPAGAVGNNPMWAKATIQTGTTDMQFYNLGGVIRFKLSQPTKEFKVVKAMISSDRPMSGEFRLDDITDSPAKKATITKAGPGITITPENPVTISKTGEASFYFAVPENTYTGVQITLVGDTGEKVTAKLGAGIPLVVKRAEVVRLKAEGITPSIEGSNCFIGEGNVPIVIKAMGNAFDNGTALDGNDEKAVWKPLNGNVDDCEVIWETINTVNTPAPGTIVKSATYSNSNGILTIVPTGAPGNALVAVKKDGVIVWSYHIWVPATPINNVSITNSTGNFVFLDRNLGALRVADPNLSGSGSIGLSYQWGRKDPILGNSAFYQSAGALSLMNNVTGKFYSSGRTLLDAIQHPDCIMGSTGSTFPDKWTTDDLSNLWGWSTGSDLSKATQNKKSIYDPCPAGYRVPGDSEYINALGAGTNTFRMSQTNSVFQFTDCPGLSFPDAPAVYSGTAISLYNAWDAKRFVWTAVKRYKGTEGDTAWHLQLRMNGSSTTQVGQAKTGSNGWYERYATNVRCIRDSQSSGNGYSLVDLDQEEINFFD